MKTEITLNRKKGVADSRFAHKAKWPICYIMLKRKTLNRSQNITTLTINTNLTE